MSAGFLSLTKQWYDPLTPVFVFTSPGNGYGVVYRYGSGVCGVVYQLITCNLNIGTVCFPQSLDRLSDKGICRPVDKVSVTCFVTGFSCLLTEERSGGVATCDVSKWMAVPRQRTTIAAAA